MSWSLSKQNIPKAEAAEAIKAVFQEQGAYTTDGAHKTVMDNLAAAGADLAETAPDGDGVITISSSGHINTDGTGSASLSRLFWGLGLAPGGPLRHRALRRWHSSYGGMMTRTLLLLASLVSLCAAAPPANAQAHYRQRGKAVLNDSAYTPGDTLTTDTAVVCHRKTGTVRAVTEAEKRQVYVLYGLPPTGHKAGAYEVDHLISLELGGSNAITNLWPEPAAPKPGFHQKDVLENTLHRMACSGAISLRAAQTAIATDWTIPYVKFVLHYQDDAGS